MKTKNKFIFFDRTYAVYFLLTVIPLLLYFKSLWFDFSPLDEQWMIFKNVHFLERWENLKHAFLQPTAGIYYRPLFLILLITEYHLGQLNPFVYHFSSLVLHLATVVLLYRFLLNFEVDKKTAFLLTLVFSVHPVLLHSVAWIPGSNDLILGVTTLASLLFLQSYIKEKKELFLTGHLVFFMAALFTKENAIVLPLIFAALYAIQNQFRKKELLRLCFFWLTLIAGWFMLRKHIIDTYPPSGTDLFLNAKQFFMALLLFIGKAVLPIQQSVFPTLNYSSLIPGLIATGLMVVAWFKPGVKNKRYALLGLALFFSLLILPVWFGASNTSGEHYEHRVYTSMAGLMLFVSQLNFKTGKKFSYALIFVGLLYSAKTFIRMDVYRDRNSFLEAGINEAPDYYLFYVQKADLLFEMGQSENAIACYTKAIALRPNSNELYTNRGHIYAVLKKYNEAIRDFSSSIAVSKNNPEAYLNRCISYSNINDLDHAIKDLAVLKKYYPGSVPPAIDRNITRRWSVRSLDKISGRVAADPENARLYVDRAIVYAGAGQKDKALADLQKACALEPGNEVYKTYLKQLNGH